MRTKGFLERGLPVLLEPGEPRLGARGVCLGLRSIRRRTTRMSSSLIRRDSIKHPEVEIRKPAPAPSRSLRD